jgi:hypothetical protein
MIKAEDVIREVITPTPPRTVPVMDIPLGWFFRMARIPKVTATAPITKPKNGISPNKKARIPEINETRANAICFGDFSPEILVI